MDNNQNNQKTFVPIFGTYQGQPPKYTGKVERSIYISMRDGVRIAIDVVLPKGLPEGEKIPTLLHQSRYWRGARLRAPFRWFMSPDSIIPKDKNPFVYFATRGYAIVIADVRGTGASFGVHRYPWAEETIADAREIVEWIISQPWSDGKIGTFGCSFTGMTAEIAATIEHPAVKVVMPQFNHPDPFLDIAHPGGVFNERFIQAWHTYDKTLDHNLLPESLAMARILCDSVKTVDEDADGKILKKAVQDHLQNGDVYELARKTTFRDDLDTRLDFSEDKIAIHQRMDAILKSNVVFDGWGSWMDAGTADAVLRRFLTFDNAKRSVIGAWSHDGYYNASQFVSGQNPDPMYRIQLSEMQRIFDMYLKGHDCDLPEGKVLYYYTMGEEKWKSTQVWPPLGVKIESWYFHSQNTLSTDLPAEMDGCDRYAVNDKTTTGSENVWWEMGVTVGKTVRIPNRKEQTEFLQVYCTSPLDEDIEISGYPVATLFVTSTETDGNFFVYLEDVDPQGNVTYITEGQFRAIHRKVSEEQPPYAIQVPYHSYKQADAMPLVPGEVAELKFGLRPTSALIRKNHRIRISLAGHDTGTFAPIPGSKNPVIGFHRTNEYASRIDLPVLRR